MTKGAQVKMWCIRHQSAFVVWAELVPTKSPKYWYWRAKCPRCSTKMAKRAEPPNLKTYTSL